MEAIESFIGQNVDEMSGFSNQLLKEAFLELLNTYNERLGAVESDKSVLIKIPLNLHNENSRLAITGARR